MSSSSLYPNRNLSLIERKKLQWAKEREELSELGVSFGNKDTTIYFDYSYPRYRAIAKSSSDYNTIPVTSSRDSNSTIQPPQTRPSLPPLCRNSQDGTTSGYVSAADTSYQPPNTAGYESSSSGTDRLGTATGGDRPRWQQRLHNNAQSDSKDVEAPNWVRRALERDSDEGGPGVIVANSSPAESPDQQQQIQMQHHNQMDGEYHNQQMHYQEHMGGRPETATSSTCNKSYIRGQNAYIDPGELEARERRRQMALVHQEAVRAQLEERERQRLLSLAEERRIEKEEEARVRRDQELKQERQREEQRQTDERMNREIQRKEAIKVAIALAELQAKEERSKQRRQRLNNLHNINENVIEIDKLSLTDRNNKIDEDITSGNNEESHNNNTNNSTFSTPSSTNALNKKSIVVKSTDNNNIQYVLQTDDNLALVLPTEDIQMQNLHLATIVPLSISSTPRNQIGLSEERVLTPSIYRFQNSNGMTHFQSSTGKVLRDVSTQTDPLPPLSQSTDHSLPEVDPSPMSNSSNNCMSVSGKRLLCTTKNSTTNTNNTDVETPTRPKWGVNRPPTRYLKQSEKDLLYVQQHRRVRPRHQRRSTYDDKRGQSSDDSGSPRLSQRNTRRVLSHRTSTALWRQQRDLTHLTEVVPFVCCCNHRCYHHYHRCNQQSAMVAMTTQECCYVQQQQHQQLQQQLVENQSPSLLQLPDVNNRTSMFCGTAGANMCCGTNTGCSSDDVLHKLQSLHNGLAIKQAQFESFSSTV